MELTHGGWNGIGGTADVRQRALLAALMALVVGAAAWSGGAPWWPSAAADRTATAAVVEAFADLPLRFVENHGQTDARVHLSASGPGYGVFLTSEEIVVSLTKAPADGVDLALRFLGGDPNVVPQGVEPSGVANYLRGADAAAWQTGVPAFGAAVYPNLWPGIDLLLRGEAGELKYEFHVAPGARPSDIRLAYAGADGLTLDHEGGLLLGTPVGPLRDAPPIAYQVVDGTHVPIDAHYRLVDGGADGAYGFAVSGYRSDRPLVIDPGLEYATFVGGSSHEQAHGVAVDAQGNTIVVGMTQSDDFPTTTGAVDRTFNGGVMDVFVAKLRADGSGLAYATYMGGTPAPLRRGSEAPTDVARAVAVDGNGNAYVTGQTTSPDFPTTSGAFQPTINASPDVVTDAFVSKLSPTGALVYSTFLGGSFWEDGRDIVIDADGNATVVGETSSDDLPITSAAVQPARAGGRDAFVTTLNASGSGLLYSTYLGGASELDRADAVALDGAGGVHVAGSTRSVDFPTTSGSFQPVHSGGDFADLFEVFVAKIDRAAAGSAGLVYSTFLGTPRMDLASDLAVDADGHAHVTGSAGLSSEFPTTAGAYDTAGTTGGKSFVTKLTSDGSALVYSTFFRATRIALESDGSAWLAGGTGAGAETTPDAVAGASSGGNDAYVGRLDPTGGALQFATYLGGSQGDGATAIALGDDGSVHLAGNTMSADFPTTVGAFDRTWAGDPAVLWGDAFVAKLSAAGGGDTTPPPPARDTATFSGRLDKNQTVTNNLAIGATGQVDMELSWTESRAAVTLRVRDPSGASVFFDGSTARPKLGTFTAATTGTYRFEVANTTDRRTDYALSVTYPSGTSSEPPSGSLSTLSVSPTSVTGGTSATGSVVLTMGAPSGGASVLLSSSDPSVASVPASVSVPATQTSASFPVSTVSVETNRQVTISATYGGVTRTATLSVNAADAGALSSITLDPTTVTGGDSSTATVVLTTAAPAGGALVNLGSSNTEVAPVPSSVTVPAGSATATFPVSTSPQEFDQSSAISASYGGVMRSVILSVRASASTTDTVTVSRAEYTSDKQELRVEASSSASGATLRAYVTATGELIGTLSGGRGEFSWPTNPQSVTVRSSLGGEASRAVTLK